jgi:hypothetical protein
VSRIFVSLPPGDREKVQAQDLEGIHLSSSVERFLGKSKKFLGFLFASLETLIRRSTSGNIV